MASKEEVKAVVKEALDERTYGSVSLVPLSGSGVCLFSLATGKLALISNVYHAQLIQRAIKNNGNDLMLSGELTIVGAYITAVNPPATAAVDTAALAEKLSEISQSADEASVKKAVREALAETVITIK